MDDSRSRVQQRFGTFAQNYVTSAVHSKSYSLDRLVELVDPAPGKRALDIATGGGHVALALARRGADVIASDLTPPMLRAAQKFISEQGVSARFAQVDAQHIPFADNSLDIVTCRIAPHHFPDVAQFVRECARVVRPGGIVGVVDQVGPAEAEPNKFVNAFERLRDPSHIWEHSEGEWVSFFVSADLQIRHQELARNRLDFDWWTQMQSCDADTVMRLRVMLRHAPGAVGRWIEPEMPNSGAWSFSLWQLILIGVKTG
jgi:ubiquinone/menaquinone biosynthesis C-methylase UbiE